MAGRAIDPIPILLVVLGLAVSGAVVVVSVASGYIYRDRMLPDAWQDRADRIKDRHRLEIAQQQRHNDDLRQRLDNQAAVNRQLTDKLEAVRVSMLPFSKLDDKPFVATVTSAPTPKLIMEKRPDGSRRLVMRGTREGVVESPGSWRLEYRHEITQWVKRPDGTDPKLERAKIPQEKAK